MALEIKQSLKLTQQLVMTPQLQQAIKLLQLSRLELLDLIRQEIKENPILEEGSESPTEKVNQETQITEEFGSSPGGKEGIQDTPKDTDFDWRDYLYQEKPPGIASPGKKMMMMMMKPANSSKGVQIKKSAYMVIY
jgi:RNA polymerase sigma-54 factor